MAASTPMRIQGGPELVTALKRVKGRMETGPEAMEALSAGGRVIADAWAARVPVLDGNYQAAMRSPDAVVVRDSKTGARATVKPARLAGLPRNDQPRKYGHRLEFGLLGITAQPSCRPAVDSSKAQVAAVMAEHLADIADRTPKS